VPIPRVETIVDEPSVRALYEQLLEPNFPPEELAPLDHLIGLTRSGAAVGGDPVAQPDGVILASRSADTFHAVAIVDAVTEQVDLLSYLAVRSDGRSGGYGSALLAAVRAWGRDRGRAYVLAEIELPQSKPLHVDHGDPRRRARFYARAGARALKVEHWQPPTAPDYPPVQLTLIAIPTGVDGLGPIAADQVREFELAYHEGKSSPELTRSLSDMDGRRAIELVELAGLYG
jgi:GNAT superfamily N-acetyltransferase